MKKLLTTFWAVPPSCCSCSRGRRRPMWSPTISEAPAGGYATFGSDHPPRL